MSTRTPARNPFVLAHRTPDQRSSAGDEHVARAIAIASLLTIGAMHFLQIVATFEATPLLGVAYVLLIGAVLAVAVRLFVHGGDQLTWMASAVVCAAAIAGYAFTRVFNTALDNQDVGNWACMLGLAALFVEITLMALSAYAAMMLTGQGGRAATRFACSDSEEPGSIRRRNSSAA
jgi:hypothetical protein